MRLPKCVSYFLCFVGKNAEINLSHWKEKQKIFVSNILVIRYLAKGETEATTWEMTATILSE